jgi:predicted aminopeptidase
MLPSPEDYKKGDHSLGHFVNLILHESAHASFHFKGSTEWNEQIATFIGDQLTEVYFQEKELDPEKYHAYQLGIKEMKERMSLLRVKAKILESIYSSASLSQEQKRSKKKEIVEELVQDLAKSSPRGKIARSKMNNAYLLQFLTYDSESVPFLEVFTKDCNSSWELFFESLKNMESLKEIKPEEGIQKLAEFCNQLSAT